MFNINIREIKKEDIPKINTIYNLHWNDQEFRDRLMSRIEDFFKQTSEMIASDFKYFVAEKDNEVVGVIGTRKTPTHMSKYVTDSNSYEIYILAVQIKNHGAGKTLINKVISVGEDKELTSLILYSDETHRESHSFYKHLGFEILDNNAIAPNGEKGVIFRKKIKQD